MEARAKRAQERIVAIVAEMRTREMGGLLSDVALLYERYGPTLAEKFVVGKREDSAYAQRKDDLNRIVQIIGVLEAERLRPAHGGYILKKLDALREFYGRAKED